MGDYPHTQSVTYNGVGGKQVEGLKVRLGLGAIYHNGLILTQGDSLKTAVICPKRLPTNMYRVSKHKLLHTKLILDVCMSGLPGILGPGNLLVSLFSIMPDNKVPFTEQQ